MQTKKPIKKSEGRTRDDHPPDWLTESHDCCDYDEVKEKMKQEVEEGAEVVDEHYDDAHAIHYIHHSPDLRCDHSAPMQRSAGSEKRRGMVVGEMGDDCEKAE